MVRVSWIVSFEQYFEMGLGDAVRLQAHRNFDQTTADIATIGIGAESMLENADSLDLIIVRSSPGGADQTILCQGRADGVDGSPGKVSDIPRL